MWYKKFRMRSSKLEKKKKTTCRKTDENAWDAMYEERWLLRVSMNFERTKLTLKQDEEKQSHTNKGSETT